MRLKLEPGEHIIAAGRPFAGGLWKPLVLAAATGAVGGYALGWLGRDSLSPALLEWQPYLQILVAVLAAAVLLRFCLPLVVRWFLARYILTNRRLIHRQGVFRRSEHEVALASIYQVEVSQAVSERMSRSGTLIVDMGYGRIVYYAQLPEVHRFKSLVVSAIGQLPLTRMFDGVDMDGDGEYDYEGRIDEGR